MKPRYISISASYAGGLVVLLLWGCDRTGMAGYTKYAKETARYEELMREQLTATDVREAFKKVDCEGLRLIYVIDPADIDSAMEAAWARHKREADPAASRRVDDALAGGVYPMDEGACRKLAKAGVLGDTVWPEIHPR